jgi:AcrR family transcriptional regulator
VVYTVYITANSTASKIVTAARRLLDKEGTEAVTMRRIAAAVGVTPMAIYRYYPGRASLLNALADDGFEELAARLDIKKLSAGVEERLTKMMQVYLEHALQRPRLFELMFLKPREGARSYPRDFKAGRSPTANLLVEVVQSGMDSGYFRRGDAWEMVFEMGALSHGLLLLYLGGRMAVPPAHFRAFYRRSFRRFMQGIRK